MDCPRCAHALKSVRAGSYAVDGCGHCGGVWLDNRASTHLVRVLDRDLVRVADLASQAAQAPFAGGEKATCPSCKSELARVEHAGVSIDVCAAHGTWFDRDEMQEIAKRAYDKRKTEVVKRDGPIGVAPTALNSGSSYDNTAEIQDQMLGTAVGVGVQLAIGILGSLADRD